MGAWGGSYSSSPITPKSSHPDSSTDPRMDSDSDDEEEASSTDHRHPYDTR